MEDGYEKLGIIPNAVFKLNQTVEKYEPNADEIYLTTIQDRQEITPKEIRDVLSGKHEHLWLSQSQFDYLKQTYF